MINVALPEIMHDFQEELKRVDLIVVAYLMVISITLVFWGRLGDTVGKGKIYAGGICLFGMGALLCSLSQNLWQLVLTRSIQACGAGMMMATGPALIKLVTPVENLGKMLGLVGIATSAGLTCGPVISGYLLTHYSWRAIFFVSLPVSLLLALLAIFGVLPKLTAFEKRHPFPFDWKGGIVWMLLVICSVCFFKVVGISIIGTLLVTLLIAVLVVVFIRVERHADRPILPLQLVSNRYFWTATIAASLAFSALFIVIILLPFFLKIILNYTPDAIGLTMMALPVSLVLFSPLSGWIFDTTGSARYVSSTGLFLGAIAVCMMLRFGDQTSQAYIAFCLGLLGCGVSIFLTPNSASVLTRVQQRFAGISAGILATARNFGMMSGAAIAGAGFTLAYRTIGHGKEYSAVDVQPENFIGATHFLFIVALLLLAIGCGLSIMRQEQV
ncbi:MFS transporter [Desulfopila sp. IMCC35008]|uniref:MFS transporter n=1 Tax=Desulfopila sp. IMCC35008 TaxID=2653858 RepID=UPI0013D5212E|nr:MFS transporter [Desulfopila sp. IMCC35008]